MQQRAEPVVPTHGSLSNCAVTFDDMSHVALPLNLEVDCRAFDDLLVDARRSVARCSRLHQLRDEILKLGNVDPLAAPETAREQLHDGSSALKDIKALRASNEAAAARALEVLRSMLGTALMDEVLGKKIADVLAHTKELKSTRRRKLDRLKAEFEEELKRIPAERKEMRVTEEQLETSLAAERAFLTEFEKKCQLEWDEHSDRLRSLERTLEELTGQVEALQRGLASRPMSPASRPLSPDLTGEGWRTPDGRDSGEEGTPGLAETKEEKLLRHSNERVALLKKHAEKLEAKHADLSKMLFDNPSKTRADKTRVIHAMEQTLRRAVESNRKRLQQLKERVPKLDTLISGNDEKRVTLEVEFRRELVELVSFEQRQVEQMLDGGLVERLRAARALGLRRYAHGQALVVRLPSEATTSAPEWCDAIVHATESSSYVHTVRLGDGNHVTLMLHAFNHAPMRLPCADWTLLRAQYSTRLHAECSCLTDALTGRQCDILQHCLHLSWSWKGDVQKGDVHDVSEFYRSQHISTSGMTEGSHEPPLCVLLKASAASGKTSILRQLASLASQSSEHLVPIFIRVADLQRYLNSSRHRDKFEAAWNWVDAYLRAVCEGEDNGPSTYAMLRQAMISRRALLLLDGLNEAGSNSETIETHIIHVMRPQGHWMMISSREWKCQWPADVMHARIEPLSSAQQHSMINQRLGHGPLAVKLQDYVEHFRRNQSEFEPSHSMILMIIALYEQRIQCLPEEDPDEEEVVLMPVTTAELYAALVQPMFDRLETEALINAQGIIQMAAFLAHTTKQSLITPAILEKAALALLCEEQRLPGELRRSLTAITNLIAERRLPLLTMTQADPLQFQFSHLSLQAYFFALTACRGFTLPPGAERPWQWSIWWSSALAFGNQMKDSFSTGLLRSCGPVGGQFDRLDLQQKVGEQHRCEDEEAAPSQTLDRTLPILALSTVMKNCHTLDLRMNRLNASEMATLSLGLNARVMTSLNLSSNRIGCAGFKAVISPFLADETGGALKDLEVADCGIGLSGTLALARFLSQSTVLELLDIRGNDPTDEGIRALGMALLSFEGSVMDWLQCDSFDLGPGVTALSLRPFLDADSTVTLLAGVLKHDSSANILDTIKVYDTSLSVEGSSALAHSMRSNRTMTSLSLSNVKLGDDGIIAVANGFKDHGTLTLLELDRNAFTHHAAKALATSLRGCSSLTRLNLGSNRIADAGVKLVVDACASLPSISNLDLSANSITTSGFKSIATLIQSNAALTYLDASRNDPRGDGLRALGNAMLTSKASRLAFVRLDVLELSEEVAELHLRERMLIAGVAPLIAALMMRNSVLTKVDLRSNGLGPTGAEVLAKGVAGSRSLAELNLAHNFIKADGLKAIAHGVGLCKQLTAIDLSDNQVCGIDAEGLGRHTIVGVKALANALGRSNMVAIKLSGNRLEVDGAKALAPAFGACKTLLRIELEHNNLTFFGADPSGVEQLMFFATAGAPEEVSGPEEARKLNLMYNHLNKRAWEVQVKYDIGKRRLHNLADTSRMHIISERCACHYCQVHDDEKKGNRLEMATKALEAGILLGPGSSPLHAEHRAALGAAMHDVANRASSIFSRPVSATSAARGARKAQH